MEFRCVMCWGIHNAKKDSEEFKETLCSSCLEKRAQVLKKLEGDTMKDKHEKVMLVKKFKNYEDKVIYTGTRRGAEKRIPESKKDQYEIIPIEY